METEFFKYQNDVLYTEGVNLKTLAATRPTPFYVYSAQALDKAFQDYQAAFSELSPLIAFAMKANSNQAIIRRFIKQGAGVDVVSGGELLRALKAGADPQKIVFSGVGKTDEEIALALTHGILQFNVESEAELDAIQSVAQTMNRRAPIALRVNPNVDPKTHPYISTGLKKNKFGIHFESARAAYLHAKTLDHLDIIGISCHIGSQLTDFSPLVDSAERVKSLVLSLKQDGISLRHIDLGGGLGIQYLNETAPSKQAYAEALAPILKEIESGLGHPVRLILEPGRSLVGNAGILVTRVIYTKPNPDKTFVVVDAAMNDLMRPALYGAYQHIQPVEKNDTPEIPSDVVGPICETGDFLAKDRPLAPVKRGDLLTVMSAGAYGSSMSSTYNSRPLVEEILVKGTEHVTIRTRSTIDDLIARESLGDTLI